MQGKKLASLAMAAWSEAFGVSAVSPEALQKQKADQEAALQEMCQAMLAEIRGGKAGIKKWNARPKRERNEMGPMHALDFKNAKLAGIDLSDRDLQGCTFEGANLRKASLWSCKVETAKFAHADLTDARMAFIHADSASFEGAKLRGCDIHIATLTNVRFRGADLTGAKLDFSWLEGADFTGATLQDVDFTRARYNERTIFPKGFTPPENMQWTGPPPDLSLAPAAPGTLDFPTFYRRLAHKVDPSRLAKALAMLKAERFQLFSEVADGALVGVVKSQSSKELVYSCRLTAEGAFGCCTQNLRPCGGLQGALCKHLLVLLVGLAKAGQLDPATGEAWAEASKKHKPAIDQQIMSDTFVRYKGAQAGEIDWRPTETIPEDYYAL
jgi:uncharacterized protein YjbI with pentapeptide repeats